MRIISFIFLLAIILFGATFAYYNSDSVTITYYFLGQLTLPLSLLLVSVFAIGCLIGVSVGFWLLVKAKITQYRLQRKLTLVEKEIQNLRAIPLQDKV